MVAPEAQKAFEQIQRASPESVFYGLSTGQSLAA